MTLLAEFWNDSRRRNLAVLAILALLSIGAAALSIGSDSISPESHQTHSAFLPDFAQSATRAARIRITSSGSSFDLVFSPEKGWLVPQRHSYPASFEQIEKLLTSLSAMEAFESKTAQKEWLARIDLDDPAAGGKGVGVRVSDGNGAILADIVVGKREALENGRSGFYARKASESQSWLVNTDFAPPGDASSWLDKSMPAIAVGRIRRAGFEPINGPSFAVSRTKADAAFTLQDIPEGRTLADPNAPNDLGTLLADFDFDDARPIGEVDFHNAPRTTVRTFDGLSVTIDTTRMDSYYWARVTAMGDTPKAIEEARTLSSRTGNWAYRLTSEKGQQFFTTLERLLAPKTDKK